MFCAVAARLADSKRTKGEYMKNQYYADSRDVAKWTALVRLARKYSLDTIMQIAMLTPDDVSAQGSQRNDPPDADPIVARFFAAERKAISGDASLKHIDRVTRLGSRYKPPLTIVVVSNLLRSDRRESYLDAIYERISSTDRRIVAFVDPDIGISIGRPSDRHITENELNSIWSGLKPGSVFAAFQYQQRRREWVDDSRQCFARALRVYVREVGVYTYPSVSFVFARKMERDQSELIR